MSDIQKVVNIVCMQHAVTAYKRLLLMNRADIADIAEVAIGLIKQQDFLATAGERISLPHIQGTLTPFQALAHIAVALDILSGHKLTERAESSFSEWLIPAKKIAGPIERRN